jgi:hypothetical protein
MILEGAFPEGRGSLLLLLLLRTTTIQLLLQEKETTCPVISREGISQPIPGYLVP